MTTNEFISPALAEERNVFCGWCSKPVLGHLQGCPHCLRPFYANMHGYARLCKRDGCSRTETSGNGNGYCLMHQQERRARKAHGQTLPKCACGNTATSGYKDCRRCRELREGAAQRCPHGVKMIPGNVCVECQEEYAEMRRDDARNYESRG